MATEDYNPSGEITDLGSNETQADSLWLGQYKDSETLKALLNSYVSQLDILQTTYLAVHYDRWIDNAVGVQLDVLGRIVVEPRNGRDDDSYRRAIQSRVLVNKSNGKLEELIQIALTHEPDLTTYLFREYYPNSIVAELLGLMLDDPRELATRLSQASGGGIDMHVITLDVPQNELLMFSDAQDPVTYDNHNGFATTPDMEPPVFGGLCTHAIPKTYL